MTPRQRREGETAEEYAAYIEQAKIDANNFYNSQGGGSTEGSIMASEFSYPGQIKRRRDGTFMTRQAIPMTLR